MAAITKNHISPHIPRGEYPKTPDLEMRLRIIWGRGIFDRRSYKAMMRHVDNTDIAIDIGGHVGSWSIPLSRTFRDVLTFEPEPTLRRYLRENISKARRTNIVVVPKAVTEGNGLTGEFYLRSFDKTRNSGMPHLVLSSLAEEGDINVECVPLDNMLNGKLPQGRHVGLIKIDVEGMELGVLKSGVKTIAANHPTLLVEINSCCERYGISKNDVLDFIDGLGYREVEHIRNDHIFVSADHV
jgi:FkbM family methyltransferase